MPRVVPKPLERYTVDTNTGCWLWLGHVHKRTGYGSVWAEDRVQLAHRFFYEKLVGPIPSSRQIDHICNNPSCVNPKHLELVSPKENIRRSGRVKLDETTVARIRASNESVRSLADKFMVSYSHIYRIKCGKRRTLNPQFDN